MSLKKQISFILFSIAYGLVATAYGRSEAFQPGFVDKLIKPYLAIQESLANDNLPGAKSGAVAYVKVVQGAYLAESDGEEKLLIDPAKSIASAIRIEDARLSFARLSNEFLSIVEQVGLTADMPLYAAHCPMASDGEGGHGVWVQKDEVIMNPYFGAKMLHCGAIDKQLNGE